MNGRICLITGATSGIGKETARALAAQYATLVLIARSRAKAEATVTQLKRETGNQAIEYLLADLSSIDQIRQVAGEFKHRYQRLHVLVNNAGAVFLRRQFSVDGIELTFATNHLNYFLLTHLLLDLLKSSAPSRIVNVSSNAHTRGRLDLDDLDLQQGYNGMDAYGRSKLANLLFTYELARRLEGTGVTVNAVHPGFVASNLGANNFGILGHLAKPLVNRFVPSAEEGAQTSVYLATSPEVAATSGCYFVDKRPIASSEASYDQAAAMQLWEISEKLVGSACQ